MPLAASPSRVVPLVFLVSFLLLTWEMATSGVPVFPTPALLALVAVFPGASPPSPEGMATLKGLASPTPILPAPVEVFLGVSPSPEWAAILKGLLPPSPD